MSRKKNNQWDYGNINNPPPFRKGDYVIPTLADSRYPGWKGMEPREIEDVVFDVYDGSTGRWRYKIWNPVKPIYLTDILRHATGVKPDSYGGYSLYNPANFELYHCNQSKEDTTMSYRQTRFFAMQVLGEDTMGGFNVVDKGAESPIVTTPLRAHQSEARKDVKDQIREGEQWVVCQTVCLIEGEAPRPPIRVTEFR
jgi:hypothetical protein